MDAGEAAAVPWGGTAAGRCPLGRGKGGDITIELDRAAESAMLAVLSERAPGTHHVVSEEVGDLGGDGAWRVLIDPVDGSLNAKRGLEPYGATLAVAGGPQMKDVVIGMVANYTTGERYAAVRDAGFAGTRRVEGPTSGTRVELILTEMGSPEHSVFDFRQMGLLAGWAAPGQAAASTEPPDYRVRQMGSLALSLAHTALGVGDVLFCPARARAVDIAAGLLLVKEAGGGAGAVDSSDLWDQPLDLARRVPFVAWRPGLDGAMVVTRATDLWSLRHPAADR